ncbi:MAG: hypothetical protein HY791_27345 [Deltaproteobacteria bacterium]|nr:hypothetical protein [Deltaproteobacteria bacterium]
MIVSWLAILLASDVAVWASPNAREVTEFLELFVDARSVVDTSTRGPSLEGARRRSDLDEPLVVIIDEQKASLSVLRSDGTTVTRSLGADAIVRSPYTVAVSARELIELVQARPERKGDRGTTFGIGAAYASSFDPGGGPNTSQVELAVSILVRPVSKVFVRVGPSFRLPFAVTRSVVFEGKGVDVSYRRFDGAFSLAAGLESDAARGALSLGVGGSFSEANATVSGESDVSDARISPALTFEAELSVAVWGRLQLTAGFGATFVTRPARFIVGERAVFEEDPARLTARVGLDFEVPD